MENDLYLKYDSLCYAVYLNVQTKTKGAEDIVLKNFHYNNKEHKFVLAVIMACRSILGDRKVVVDDNLWARMRMAHRYHSAMYVVKNDVDDQPYVDVEDMLEFMRGSAYELCGPEFTFGDIYDAYYSGKETR